MIAFDRDTLIRLGARFPTTQSPSENALRVRRQRANRPEYYRQKNREYQTEFRARQKQIAYA